ncbi:MAG: hypothetical protein OXE59_09665 [Bacteroidetes bacterium]|nr:hypothetical protein [Bacteroidota bacterium]
MKLATVDIGTNSGKLLISEWSSKGTLIPLEQAYRMIRLGEGVDANGVLSDKAIDRLIDALSAFQVIADRWDIDQFIVTGTSASRDTGSSIIETVYHRTGLKYEILSGDQEADISFEGALGGLPHIKGHVISCDIGGGSTELVEGTSDGKIINRVSIDIGSVRITERYFSSLPPKVSELESARSYIGSSLKRVEFCGTDGETFLIGASDAQRLLLELQFQLTHNQLLGQFEQYSPSWRCLEQRDPQRMMLSCDQIQCWTDCLIQMSYADILALDPQKLNGRADVFPAAIMIFLEIMNRLRQNYITISPWGLTHGVALRMYKGLSLSSSI